MKPSPSRVSFADYNMAMLVYRTNLDRNPTLSGRPGEWTIEFEREKYVEFMGVPVCMLPLVAVV